MIKAFLRASLIAVCCCFAAAFLHDMAAQSRFTSLIREIEMMGGSIEVLPDEHALPTRVVLRLCGRDPEMERIATLGLDACAVSDNWLSRCRRMRQLSFLSLADTSITNLGISHISRLQHLETLNLSGTLIDDEALRHLSLMSTLRVLSLSRTMISGRGLRHLAGNAQLTYLALDEVTTLEIDCLDHLRGLRSLQGLSLRGAPVDDRAMLHVAACRALVSIDIGGTAVGDDGLRSLRPLAKGIAQLELDGSLITEDSVETIIHLAPRRMVAVPKAIGNRAVEELRQRLVGTVVASEREWHSAEEQLLDCRRTQERVAAEPPDLRNPDEKRMRGGRIAEREDNSLGMRFVWCPEGSFMMGSPRGEAGRHPDEAQVEVILTRGFWLGKYEVTQREWQQLMETEPWKGMECVREGPDYPASFVSWEDAMHFCRTMTDGERRDGRLSSEWQYALPSEAQWEYACRAGTATSYSFGSDASLLAEHAWYEANTWALGNRYPQFVGSKGSNRWGFHDMHGNVLEWCQDWFVRTLPGGRDPLVLTRGARRVYRGGSWSDVARDCRSAFRHAHVPSRRSHAVGFRVARVWAGG